MMRRCVIIPAARDPDHAIYSSERSRKIRSKSRIRIRSRNQRTSPGTIRPCALHFSSSLCNRNRSRPTLPCRFHAGNCGGSARPSRPAARNIFPNRAALPRAADRRNIPSRGNPRAFHFADFSETCPTPAGFAPPPFYFVLIFIARDNLCRAFADRSRGGADSSRPGLTRALTR